MTSKFDVLVIGCGGFGSAALYHLARRGLRTLGLDRFSPPHDRGSSHGETRIIRKAYFEHPNYVPLLQRAYGLWDELALEARQELFVRCGLFMAGPGDGEILAGARRSAAEHQLELETLTRAAVSKRFPMFRVPAPLEALFEPDAGYLWVERCVQAHLDGARAAGAELCFDTAVLNIEWDQKGVRVSAGDLRFEAAQALITAGAWVPRLLQTYEPLIQVLRKTQFWFPAEEKNWGHAARAPVHLIEHPTGQFYGFPSVDGQSVKLAEHSGGERLTSADQLDRWVSPAESSRLADFAATYLVSVQSAPLRSAVCLYSMSPDGHFLIDRLPDAPLVVAAGFSGHGFKFTSVLGEALADLVERGHSELPIQFLSAQRLVSGS